eukprot:403334191
MAEQNIISVLPGTLKIIVKDAKLKRDVNTFTTMDPYVQLKVNGLIYKTKVCKDGGKNPRWSEEFEISCNDPSEILEIKVMEEAFLLNDDDIGRCQIKLSQLMHGKGITEWFVLLWKNKRAGEILLTSVWDGPSRTQEVPKETGNLMTMLGGAGSQAQNTQQTGAMITPQLPMNMGMGVQQPQYQIPQMQQPMQQYPVQQQQIYPQYTAPQQAYQQQYPQQQSYYPPTQMQTYNTGYQYNPYPTYY